jgi:hypothetical protein
MSTATDAISQLLLQQHAAKSRSGEDLEVFGKHAAMKWLRGEAPTLSSAVVETVKAASLSPAQVLRVVEFANTDAYLQEFKKEGRAHRVIDFPGGPADPATVLRDLNDGGGGAGRVKTAGLEDYQSPPKQASGGIEWHREAPQQSYMPLADPLRPAMDLRVKLAGSAEHLRGQLNFVERAYRTALEEMVSEVKQAALEGTSLSEVVDAFSQINSHPELIKQAFVSMTPGLLESGAFRTPTDMANSFEKFAAHSPVNPEHPLIGAYSTFCETLVKAAELRAELDDYQENIGQLDQFLKEAAGAGGASGPSPFLGAWEALGPAAERASHAFRNTSGIIPAASEALHEVSAPVGDLVRGGLGHVFGPDSKVTRGVGGAVQMGVHHAVPIGGALGTWQAMRRPEVQRAMYEVNSRFNPASQAYNERQYMLENGMV